MYIIPRCRLAVRMRCIPTRSRNMGNTREKEDMKKFGAVSSLPLEPHPGTLRAKMTKLVKDAAFTSPDF